MTLRHKNSILHEGNNQFKGMGIVKWCALCRIHRPIQGGFIQSMYGGRYFCCALHPNPKDIKCEPVPPVTENAAKVVTVPQEIQPPPKKSKTKTPKTKKTKEESAQAAMEAVKAAMMALAAPLVVGPAKSAESETSTTSTSQKNRR